MNFKLGHVTTAAGACTSFTCGAAGMLDSSTAPGLTLSDLGVISGMVVGIAGLLIMAVSTIRRDRREQLDAAARLELYKSGKVTIELEEPK